MLEQPTFIHPELLLMKEVIDRRLDQKIKYEQTLLKFRLESLQRESIANKAQMHSQYMQTVGELRDASLAQVNAEIYQTQRERRSCEADMPDYMYAFTTKRSQQITQQTAYNEEVSLLSGVAKYVGFPAAPDVIKARANEWEEDERAYKRNLAVSFLINVDKIVLILIRIRWRTKQMMLEKHCIIILRCCAPASQPLRRMADHSRRPRTNSCSKTLGQILNILLIRSIDRSLLCREQQHHLQHRPIRSAWLI